MTTEWKEITDPEELFRLKREGWEIEVHAADCVWFLWAGDYWNTSMSFRARPRQPKMKKVKLLAYLDNNRELRRFVEWSSYSRTTWIRQPHLDLEGEFPE